MTPRGALLAALLAALALPAWAAGKGKAKAKKGEDEYASSRYKSKSADSGIVYRFKAAPQSSYKIESEDDEPLIKRRPKKKGKKGRKDDEGESESKYISTPEDLGARTYRFSEDGTPVNPDSGKKAKAKKADAVQTAAAPAAAEGGPPPAALPAGGPKEKKKLKAMGGGGGGGGIKPMGGGGGGGFGGGGGGGGIKPFGQNAGGGGAAAGQQAQ